MQIALYEGKSFFPSRLIRWITRSKISHAAWLFDDDGAKTAIYLKRGGELGSLKYYHPGAVIEAWSPKVRNTASLSDGHTPGTTVRVFRFTRPLSATEETMIIRAAAEKIGEPYDWCNVLLFPPVLRLVLSPLKRAGLIGQRDGWFCSEMVLEDAHRACRPLLNLQHAEGSPRDVGISRELTFERSETTA